MQNYSFFTETPNKYIIICVFCLYYHQASRFQGYSAPVILGLNLHVWISASCLLFAIYHQFLSVLDINTWG